ncbi:hypothetical protein BGZ68_009075 [Mortierella alpina]|nr:hypothetical protein BGZ68_009075 [Mortierella alpina]
MTQDKSFDRRCELVRLKAQADYCNTLIAFLEQEENGQQAKETDNLDGLPVNEVQRREQIAKSVGETIQHSIPDHQPATVSKMQPSCEVPSVAQQAMGSIESKLRHVLSSEGSLDGPLSQTDASIEP